MAGKKKKPIQIYLREEQEAVLRRIAEQRGESIAALVRRGVDLLLDRLPAAEDPLLDILGLYEAGQDDLAEKHDEYLVRLIQEEADREP